MLSLGIGLLAALLGFAVVHRVSSLALQLDSADDGQHRRRKRHGSEEQLELSNVRHGRGSEKHLDVVLPARPNIVLLMTDSLDGRLVDPKSNESKAVDLPFLHGVLNQKGANFVKAYSNNPFCVPSRSSMMSGRPSDTIKVYGNDGGLAASPSGVLDDMCVQTFGKTRCQKLAEEQLVKETIPTALQKMGYKIHISGKLHFGAGMKNAARHDEMFAGLQSDYAFNKPKRHIAYQSMDILDDIVLPKLFDVDAERNRSKALQYWTEVGVAWAMNTGAFNANSTPAADEPKQPSPRRSLLELSTANHQAYALRHGYEYVLHTQLPRPELEAQYNKMPILSGRLRAPSPPDWLFFIDCDAFFTNYDVSIHDVLETYGAGEQSGVNLLVAEDPGGINTGVLLLRNSPWSLAFLDRVEANNFRVAWDQSMFFWEILWPGLFDAESVVDGDFRLPREVAYAHQAHLNAFVPPASRDWHAYEWQPGDFVCHFAGCPFQEQECYEKMLQTVAFVQAAWPNTETPQPHHAA